MISYISIFVLLLAMVWSVFVLRKLRDWRLGMVSFMFGMLMLQQILMSNSLANMPGYSDRWSLIEFQSLFLSMMALLTIFFLKRILVDFLEAKKSISDKQSFLQSIIDSSPNLIFVKDKDSRYVMVNRALADVYGSTVEELAGKTDADYVSDDKQVACFRDEDLKVINNNSKQFLPEVSIVNAAGEMRYMQTSLCPLSDRNGENNLLLGVATDITERKIAEQKSLETEKRFRSYFELGMIGMAIISPEKEWLEFNDTLCDMLGYSAPELRSKKWVLMIHPDDLDVHYNEIKEVMNGNKDSYRLESRFYRKDGSVVHVDISANAIRKEGGEVDYFVSLIQDITERKLTVAQLSYQATHDALTGLSNRREFELTAEKLLYRTRKEKSEHALCFIDLDQFKVINDSCGHVAGDDLLRQLSALLSSVVRQSDMLARLGGDEFALLIENCKLDDANRVASAIQNVMQNYQFCWEDRVFHIAASIGLVPITPKTTNLNELMRDADVACYMAKEAGRNRIHVYNPDDSAIEQRHGEMQWVARINKALNEDQLCLYAQPIVPLRGNNSKHYELLIRMQDDDGKTIMPGAFLPAAERFNLIGKLDHWTIGHAFNLLNNNPQFLQDINFVSINLSGASMGDDKLTGYVIDQLEQTRVDASKICFEITETATISNFSVAMSFIQTLRGLGCHFALDDFGSGLSSFGYLKNLSVDYLKIDGMFVKDIVDDPIDRAMVRSINEIGQLMGMKTIAEFVENYETRELLKDMGVDYAQGYGIGRPQPFEELIRSNAGSDDEFQDLPKVQSL